MGSLRDLLTDLRAALAPARLRSALGELLREDRTVTATVFAFVAFELVFIGWDLPGAIGWENDGVAPRDFFTGVVANLTWGHGHRYPLFHNLLLLLASLPVLAGVGLYAFFARAPLEASLLSVPSMTLLSGLVKLLHVGMAGVLLLVLARLTRRLFGAPAGRACALAAAVSVSIGYYARVSNLDVPYLFWSVLAVDRFLGVCERGQAADYRLFGCLVAASVATKDQAYAGYAIAVPLYALGLPRLVPNAFAAGAAHFQRLRSSLYALIVSYLTLSGSIFNPLGLGSRLRLLTGPNSSDWREYTRDARGVLTNLADLWQAQTSFFWHWSLLALGWLGVLLAIVDTAGARARWLRLLPLCLAVSSLLCFTLPTARAEHRFALPFGIWFCVYAGAAYAWLERRAARTWPLLALSALGWLLSLFQCVELGLTQLGDARQAVSALLSRLPDASVVEIYGFSVYQPHLDLSEHSPYHVQRIGKEPAAQRARLLGVSDVVDDYAHFVSRKPAALVVTEGFARQFLPRQFRPGQAPSVKWLESHADADAVSFFGAAVAEDLSGYRLALCSSPRLASWAERLGARPIAIHDSTANRVWLFLRNDVKLIK